ncbi:MAG TPA: DsbA family protein [Spirillospora sp.]|nr:DsbA family protein [Spirillospora sp.]
MAMALIIYADFGSLDCYLASRRVDALVAAGVAVDWRAVEQHPELPVAGRRLSLEEHSEMERRMDGLAALMLPGEELPWAPPRMMPKTEAALSGYAEAYGADVGDDVRRLLYGDYWVDGADIGDPEILRRRLAGPILRGRTPSWTLGDSGYAVSVSRGPITTGAWRRIRAWRDEWASLGTGGVPTLVQHGGAPITGEAALRRLEEEIVRSGAAVDPDLPDPSRYPESARPSKDWVSRTGAPWARAWMAGT